MRSRSSPPSSTAKVRIVSDPPLIVRYDELVSEDEADAVREAMHEWFRGYRATLQPDRRNLVESYELIDFARKVVGVGSVGTRCWIAYLRGRDDGDPLFLQIKEAEASVLEPYVAPSEYSNHGRRVVEGQRLTQAASDIFLGWDRAEDLDGESAGLLRPPALGREALGPGRHHGARGARDLRRDLRVDARAGARTIRATAWRSPRTSATGRRSTARSPASPTEYADQNDRDYAEVVAAIDAGELEVDRSEMTV